MPQYAEISNDEVVTAIIKDLTAGVFAAPDDRAIHFERAVHSLRFAAANSTRTITQEQRRQIDAAILVAQPYIVQGDNAADLRFMVGALHVITGEIVKGGRPPLAEAPSIFVEAISLTRLLENHLNSAAITILLRRKRSGMNEVELLAMKHVVDTFYPVALAPGDDVTVRVSVH